MAERRPGLAGLLSRLVLAGVGVVAAPFEAEGRERELRSGEEAEPEDLGEAALALAADPLDAATGGYTLAILLEHMDPFDATRTAAAGALSDRVEVRRALGEALTWIFPLLGDDVVIDHLSRDADVEVRFAAVRAAHARLAPGDDTGVLARLCDDDSSFVAHAAVLALMGAPVPRRR
jgi:hypothetical protein